MIYWYRWGRHTLDVRVLRNLLGLPEENDADIWFDRRSAYYSLEEEARGAIFSQIRDALGSKPFKELVKEHDAAIKAA